MGSGAGEDAKMSKSLEAWKNISASVQLFGDNVRGSVECPRCGERHQVDEPEEISQEWLYCDTFDERIPFPKPVLEAIKREALKVRQTNSRKDAPTRVSLDVNLAQQSAKIEFRIDF